MKTRALWIERLAAAWLLCFACCAAERGTPTMYAEEKRFADLQPLVPANTNYGFNEYWEGRRIGPRDFYLADQGPYLRISEEGVARLKQVGFYDRTIPGHINQQFIKYFLPAERAKLKDGPMKTMFEDILKNKWPIHTISYCRFQGNPPPTQELIDIIKEQWIGDGQCETVYRLEPVFHYLKTGERWEGSSMYLWKPDVAKKFFKEELVPRLEKEFPFLHDLNHAWTRPELRRLSDIYCEEFYRPEKRALPWGMYVGNYHLAASPDVIAAGEKGADAFSNARARGTMRQFGGRKFYFVWRGHEPTEMYTYPDRAWFTTRGEEWGMPLPHIWYYVYRPYLIGANCYVNEMVPAGCIQDIEGDGQLELSTLGHIYKDMLDFADRHPERGTAYAPIALMLDYNRSFPAWGVSYFGYNLPNDDADFMNQGIFETLFPEHRHATDCGGYMRTAPYGEIFDILQPNMPRTGADPKALANYRTLIALGGMTFDEDFSKKVKEHVRQGGTLVLNAADATEHLGEDFLGLARAAGTPTAVPAGDVTCLLCGKVSAEPQRLMHIVKAGSAETVFKDAEGRPVVLRNRYGNGHVIVIAAHYGIEREARKVTRVRGPAYTNKNLLNFMSHFFEHLTAGATPIEVRRAVEDRPDLSWIVARKGDGWVVTMFNYSLAREPIIARTLGTAKVHAEYPLRETPFEIVCRAPTEDVVEWYGDRDAHWKKADGKAIVSETMRGGEIRVYEFQPQRIDFGRRTRRWNDAPRPPSRRADAPRRVNYALNRPVKASSFLKGHEPARAVDGNTERESYWWSDTDAKRHYVFDMPQWIEVDLGQTRTIDHIFTLFYWWQQESLQTRLRVYKYIVEASLDGKTWQTVIDESRNEDNSRPEGLDRWFDPTPARYVRLTVSHAADQGGARLIEMKVTGSDEEEYAVQRRSIIPSWEVQYPAWLKDVPEEKITYLLDLVPEKVSVGWMPAGKTWEELNGEITLITTFSGMGRLYKKAVYAEAPSEIVYDLGGKYKTFAAAAGLGTNSRKSSVEFCVLVDDRQRYKSPLFRCGMAVLPVVVDVSGGKKLSLVVTDGGDGLIDDYSWWTEARLIKR